MFTPAVCFGSAQEKECKQDLYKMDIVFRRLLRSTVGPPDDMDGTLPWHEILHHWNERVNFLKVVMASKDSLLYASDHSGNLPAMCPVCERSDASFEY